MKHLINGIKKTLVFILALGTLIAIMGLFTGLIWSVLFYGFEVQTDTAFEIGLVFTFFGFIVAIQAAESYDREPKSLEEILK